MPRGPDRWTWRAWPVGLAIACTCILASVGYGADLVGASSDEHLWFVIERDEPRPRVELGHHTRSIGEAFYRPQMVLSSAPVALAAWEDRLWLVNGPTMQDGRSLRSVFGLQIQFNEALDLHFTEPRDRLRVIDPLPGEGRLASTVGTAKGPVALLVPRREVDDGHTTMHMPGRTSDTLPDPLLLRHERGDWQELALPDDLPTRTDLLLAAGGPAGERLTLMAGTPGETGSAVYIRGEDGTWSRSLVTLSFTRVLGLARVDEYVAVAIQDSDPRRIELAYLLGGGLRTIGKTDRPADGWVLLGLAGGLRVLSRGTDGDLMLRSIDLLNERDIGAVVLRPRPPTSGKMWAMSLLFAIALTAVILVLFIRPGRAIVMLPADMQVLPLLSRVGGLVMDLFPGAVLTMLLLHCSVRDLLLLPLMTADIGKTYPFFLMASITLAHTTVSELLTRRSLGKWLLGAELVSVDGTRPPASRVLVRCIAAAFLYVIPPLVVLGLLSPHLQGVHDQIGRIVVIRRVEDASEEAPKDR
ncbi:MAG: RDD family protein [Planctomycetota bacterium]|jgi:hypothetical protein